MVRWNAADYARNSSAQLVWARELIAELDLSGSESVLDVGCGDGRVTAEIARATSGRVVGIDRSEEMVRYASETFAAQEWPNLTFAVCDASELTFRDEFNVVFSNAALHWLKDHKPALRGIARALKPGGRAALSLGGRGNAAGVISAAEAVGSRDEWLRFFDGFGVPYGFYGPEEYRTWLAEVGLRAQRVELVPKDMVQQGREGFEGWFRTTWLPYIQRVPEEMRGKFVAEVVDQYLEWFAPDANGQVHVEMVRLEVEAAKRGNRSPSNGLWILG